MNIADINIDSLQISTINVRKNCISDIEELAESINKNGLINPITVICKNDKYEIIAGQRRYLAMKSLNKKTIPCNVIDNHDITLEISIIENIQRNNISICDKVIAYSKLSDLHNIDKVIELTKVPKATLKNYLKIKDLPIEVLKKLDETGKSKINVSIALELTKFPSSVNLIEFVGKLDNFKLKNKMNIIKEIKESEYDEIDEIIETYEEDVSVDHKKRPYIFDSISQKNIVIPEELYKEIVDIIKNKGEDLEEF
jgi:ParB family chromosome partitioning protein